MHKPASLFSKGAILGLTLVLGAGAAPAAAAQNPKPLNVLVLLGEWFGDAYFPLAKEIESRGWTMKRVGLDGEYHGCYNKKRDIVLTSDIVIQDKMDLVRDAGLIDVPDGPAIFPEKVTRIKERILLGPRGGGPSPEDGFESAPIKEVCDPVAQELTGKPALAADNASGAKAPLALTYVANMGVLVDSGGTKVLFDALFDKPNPEYRAPEPGVIDRKFLFALGLKSPVSD